MKPKIIVLAMSPYEKFTADYYFFQKDFEKEGYKFEFWSLSEKFKGFNYNKEVYSFTKYFKNVKDLVKAIENETEPFYCDIQLPLNPELYPIFRIAEKKAIKFYKIKYLDGIVSLMNSSTKQSTFRKVTENLDFRILKRKIKQKFFLYNFNYSKVKKKMIIFKPPTIAESKEIEVHQYDYIINKNSKINTSNENYFVFLDQALPDHPDFNLLGHKNIDKEIYLRDMNAFFDYVEHKYNIPVIIAGHPQSNYGNNDFNGRKIEKYKTVELVKNANIVFLHYSTSFNYAILNYKPLIFLTMNEFFNVSNKTGLHNSNKIIEKISELFDAQLININNDKMKLPSFESIIVNEKKYNDYINKYLISRNKNLTNYEIVKKYLGL